MPLYGIAYLINPSGSHGGTIPQVEAQFDRIVALIANTVQPDGDFRQTLAGVVAPGLDGVAAPVAVMLCVCVAASLTNAQRGRITDRMASAAPYARGLFYDGARTDAQMEQLARRLLGEDGASRVWLAYVDTPTTGDLLTKFEAV